MKSLRYYQKQAGVTLVELLVGMSVGLIVVGGALTIYVNTVSSSASTIQSSVLNQEMNAIMQLVSSDIRRAGYWLDTNTSSVTDPNPFTDSAYEYNITIGTWDADSSGSDEAASTCITFAYDRNQNSQVGLGDGGLDVTAGRLFTDGSAIEDQSNMEIFGFRYDSINGDIEMRQSGSSGDNFDCSDGSWWDMNDPDVVTITSFSIDTANTSCTNISLEATPNNWSTSSDSGTTTTFCSETTLANLTPSTGTTDVTVISTDVVSEIRQVNITIEGELASDSNVTSKLTRSIRIRNNRSITGLTITP
ncbi:MAG: hypothetical protein GQ470_04750 [Gammaproteobacteria bacterium]|nr:hypothetical protein [Gammaproteobacteria bacterium]